MTTKQKSTETRDVVRARAASRSELSPQLAFRFFTFSLREMLDAWVVNHFASVGRKLDAVADYYAALLPRAYEERRFILETPSATVTIQITSESKPAMPSWMG